VYTSVVKNVTFRLDERLIESSRLYAAQQGRSLNDLVREQLELVVGASPISRLDAAFGLSDELKLKSKTGWLTREEANARG
jgi:hypothetical protein